MLAVAMILCSVLAACTADDVPANRLKAERRELADDLTRAIEAVDERLESLAGGAGSNGPNADRVGTDTTDPTELASDRLRQIRSALAYRLHQIDSTPDPMWRQFRNDAEQLINDAHRAVSESGRE